MKHRVFGSGMEMNLDNPQSDGAFQLNLDPMRPLAHAQRDLPD
jgi:hypothetical protein